VWRGGIAGEAELLNSAYRRSFELAEEHHCESIALPALSAGAYGYPMDHAARVAIGAAKEALERAVSLQRVRFILFSAGAYGAFAAALEGSAVR
jgi:O-acetyl-ADP-ribose deacetylase (regulator of RNase III)